MRWSAGGLAAAILPLACSGPVAAPPPGSSSAVASSRPDAATRTLPPGAVAVEVGAHRLRGILTTGATKPAVVVVFVGGSGPIDADGTVGANTLLRDLATALREVGVASLRYDKRFAAHPELATSQPLTVQAEYLEDLGAALELVRRHPATAGAKVVLLGHSQGAMIAPAVLAADPGVVAGVLLAGTPRSLWDVVLDQQLEAVAGSGKSAPEQAILAVQLRAEAARANGLTDPDAPPVLGLPATYVVSLNQLRLADRARTLRVPLFVAQGEADFQISVERDFEAWKPVLADDPGVVYHRYAGLNHLFMPTRGLRSVQEYAVRGTLDPRFVADLTGWLVALGQ